MPKKIFAYFALPLLLLLSNSSGNSAPPARGKNPGGETGTLEKLIVANGSVAMDLDLNRLNGIASETKESKLDTLRFQVGPNSFFTVLVFNDALRGPDQGSMELIPENSAMLPGRLQTSLNQLVIEKLPSNAPFDLAVRDGKTGFVFFNVEGNLYEYDAVERSLAIKEGRLLISETFAKSLGRPADAGMIVGKISIVATMSPIEITTVVNDAPQSSILPPLRRGGGQDVPNSVPGPDVIVGDLSATQQFGSSGTQVGVAIGTVSCNNGTVALNWFAMPNTDHPVIPQNLYRMSGGTTNDERFEQIGQSWLKHAFAAGAGNACGFGCTSGGGGLGAGCSDPYGASLNASQGSLGSRAWVNPFTGVFPSTASNHTGHSDSSAAPTHRALVEMNDLNTTLNPGATYFAEAQYVTPHEYAWCQAHPGECNMYNNVSSRQFTVTGTTSFSFGAVGSTMRMIPAINSWPGATINPIEPEPGVDGRAFVAFKVTGPVAGIWHYEYALYNQNLDRSIQSFSVPLGCGITLTNIGFHAPLNHPGIANDGTFGSAGYSNAAWTSNQTAGALSWSSETFAQNQNANAIRWGTLYNFRFDSDRAPLFTNATIGYFKTGAPSNVVILAPNACNATPTPVPTPTPSPGATPIPTPTGTPTPTPTPSGTPGPTPCGTTTFSNPTTINIPDSGAGAPYPSNISVALGGTITKVTVKLNTLSHTFPADIDILLVGPGGQNAIIMSDVGGGDDASGVMLTLDDAAANSLPSALLTSGTFKPTNIGTGDTFPAPAPAPAGGSALSVFNGTNPNGTWSLYVVDDAAADLGSIGGWELTISTTTGCGTPTPSPSTTPVTTATPTPSATPTPGACGTGSPLANTTTITIPDMGAAAPYPSSIFVYPTSFATKVTVRLINFSHTSPADVDVLLVGPGGQTAIIMSDVGGSDAVAGVDLLLDDDAPNSLPGTQLTSGRFKPTNNGAGDTWPAPAPVPSGGSALSVFNWTLVGGTWSLYVVDDTGANLGSIAGGWELTLTTTNGACPTPTPTITPGITPTPSATISPPPTTPPPPSPTPTPLTPTPTPAVTPPPTPTPSPAAQPNNLSTRLRVQGGDNIGIGGFIIMGTAPKRVLLRAIGPSLTQSGVPNALADPVLELHGPGSFATISNDNWRQTQESEIQATGLAPTHDLESALVMTLNPGAYTAVVRGKNNSSGVGLVEVYDLSQAVSARLANISTRALVGTGDNIVIAGFTLGGNNGYDRVVVRGLGPSLTPWGISNALTDPTLELRDGNAALLASNNNWQDNPAQAAELTAAGLAPTNPLEAAMAATLPPGLYTALLAGLNNGAGIGLVEIYDRGP